MCDYDADSTFGGSQIAAVLQVHSYVDFNSL